MPIVIHLFNVDSLIHGFITSFRPVIIVHLRTVWTHVDSLGSQFRVEAYFTSSPYDKQTHRLTVFAQLKSSQT